MKKVLFIAYHFPPLTGGGTFRSLKYVKYLPQFGWIPTVITTNTKNYWAYDEGLLDELSEDIKVIRAKEFGPFYLQILLSKIGLGKLYKKIKNTFFIPDDKIGWIPNAYKRAVKELKSKKYDIIFSTSPTPCAHIIAMKLKNKFNLPWVSDYRDHFTLNPDYLSKGRRKDKEKKLELNFLSKSDKIILNTKGNFNDLSKNFPQIKKEKKIVIPNGYDDISLAKRPTQKLIFTYTGTFYGSRNPLNLLKAIKTLTIESKEINFIFIGPSDFDILKFSQDNNISNYIEYIKFRNQSSLIEDIETASVMMLFIDSEKKSPHVVPSKLYDYLSYKLPILAMIHTGDSYDILKKTNLGYFADPNSPEEIRNQILNLYNLWKSGNLDPKPNIEFINQFHRKNLTMQLAKLFDEVT